MNYVGVMKTLMKQERKLTGKPEREPGYYFIKYGNYDEWTIGEYFEDGDWLVIGCEMTHSEKYINEVGDKIECPHQQV